MKLILLVLSFVLVAGVANAQNAWRQGTGATDTLCSSGISPGAACFWTFNNDSTDSPLLRITAEYATVCFNPNTANATDSGATVDIQYVTGDDCSATTVSLNTSENVAATTLTGESTGGLDCLYEVPIGCIWVNPITTTTQTSVVSVRGAPVGRQ